MVIHFITSAAQKEGGPQKHRRERWECYGQMFLFPEGPKTMSGKKNSNLEEKLDGLTRRAGTTAHRTDTRAHPTKCQIVNEGMKKHIAMCPRTLSF
jgi:hypothetical protein